MVQVGGGGLNVSIGCAVSGIKPCLISMVGSDFPRADLLLIQNFIDCDFLRRSADDKTCSFDLRYYDLTRPPTIASSAGVSAYLTEYASRMFIETSRIHLCCRWPIDAYSIIVEWQNKTDASISIDFIHSSIESQFASILPVLSRVNILFMNRYELEYIRSQIDIEKIDSYLVVTDGENGADIVVRGNIIYHEDATQVDTVVDPSGAGDTFAGGCLGALVKGASIEDSVKQGVIVAGKCIMEPGTLHLLDSLNEK